MADNVARDQHTVPQVLLKQYANDDGKLWYIDKRWPKPEAKERTSKRIFFQRDIYNVEDEEGNINAELEEMYQRQESDIEEVLQKISQSVRKGVEPRLSETEKAVFNKFQFNLQKRVPDFHENYFQGPRFKKVRDEVMESLAEQHGKIPQEAHDLWDDPQFRQKLKVEVLKAPSDRALPFLQTQGLAFVRPENPYDNFVIGANPVTSVELKRKNTPSLLCYPVAHDVMATPINPAKARELILHPLTRAEVAKLNRQIAGQGRTVAGRTRGTVEKLYSHLKDTNPPEGD